MTSDLRICFVGDSFVAGVGDPEHLGWAGRLVARSSQAGRPLTAYNLGVRRETSRDVRARWQAECRVRLPATADSRLVVSFGVNDATRENGAPRVEETESEANLATILRDAAAAEWDVLVVGPPPVSDHEHNDRIERLDEAFCQVCSAAGVPFVSVVRRLRHDDTWMAEVGRGDGAHPAASGYQLLSDLVWPTWQEWLNCARRHTGRGGGVRATGGNHPRY